MTPANKLEKKQREREEVLHAIRKSVWRYIQTQPGPCGTGMERLECLIRPRGERA